MGDFRRVFVGFSEVAAVGGSLRGFVRFSEVVAVFWD